MLFKIKLENDKVWVFFGYKKGRLFGVAHKSLLRALQITARAYIVGDNIIEVERMGTGL